jgi:hypothetical protein
MPASRICTVIDAPPGVIWDRLADFPSWGEWLSQVADSRIDGTITHAVGAVRIVGPAESPRVNEQLVAVDARNLTISYCVAKEPVWKVPARDYRVTVRLIPLTDRPATVIDWSSQYDCDLSDEQEIDELLESLYTSFIVGLSRAVTSPPGPRSDLTIREDRMQIESPIYFEPFDVACRDDLFETYARLHREAPVRLCQSGFWTVVRLDDVRTMYTRTDLFSNRPNGSETLRPDVD